MIQSSLNAMGLPVFALFGHPGHELLVGQLLSDAGATVAWLSDGSGGTQSGRSDFTRSFLEDCGCQLGPIKGSASDRRFYQAIMDGDVAFLDPVITAIEAAVTDLKPANILTDPMEYFNPLHDLANTITDILIAKAAQRGVQIGKLVYANEYPEMFDPQHAAIARTLTEFELQIQRQRLEAYVPLHAEWKRMEADGKLAHSHVERLFADEARLGDIPPASQTRFKFAFYEDYGRAAVAKGIYKSCLTFADHALPFAKALVARHSGSAQRAIQ